MKTIYIKHDFQEKQLSFLLMTLKIIFLSIFFITRATANGQKYFCPIIPAPVSVKVAAGEFILSHRTKIKTESPNDKTVLLLKDFLIEKFKNTGNASSSPVNEIIFTTQGTEDLPDEGYRISITPKRITIAGKRAGIFYGIQSLMQLLPFGEQVSINIPCLEIFDYPRFKYRGMMLDVSRHFFGVGEVKKFIDLMAIYKLNRFHWHLVDNDGWRIEIKKYPKLTEAEAYRTSTMMMGMRDWFDGIPYGGYYTQEEIKEVVSYANELNITIIPEIEMPAHCASALRAYPEFKCKMPLNSKNKNAYNYIYSPTEETFKFLEDVLTEVIGLFPSKYIHIGGDEANDLPWQESVFCQELVKKQGLGNTHEIQSYIVQRIEKFLNLKGRSIIGWDEILDGGLAPNATVMSWQGEAGGIASAKQKHDVIMTPSTNGLYFDYAQSESNMEPMTFGVYMNNCAPLKKTYNYVPVPKSLTQEEQKYILGVQANVWTEFIATPAKLEYMTLPRMLALSEVAWSLPENKNFEEFTKRRLPVHLYRFDQQGKNYRVPEARQPIDTTLIGDKFTFELSPPIPGSKIYYTINESIPGDLDFVYHNPITFSIPNGEKRELQTIVVSHSGRRSIATRTVMLNYSLLPSVDFSNPEPGLKYKVFKGAFYPNDRLGLTQVLDSGVTMTISPEKFAKIYDSFGLNMDGFIKIDKDGACKFSLSSDIGAQLFIDNELVISNDIPFSQFEKTGAIPLQQGFHRIRINYYDSSNKFFSRKTGGILKITMCTPDTEEKEITSDVLFH